MCRFRTPARRGSRFFSEPDLLEIERSLWNRGLDRVAGIDEAGRGPWAGPVVAACVLLPAGRAGELLRGPLHGLTDSKKLTPAARDRFFDRLTSDGGVAWSIAEVDAAEIDRTDILRATYRAMALALAGLPGLPDRALVDGRPVPGLPCPAEAFVRGDARSLSIAAASVLAKVRRDRLMAAADRVYPGYGFARHKGYGTSAHREALQRLGPCPIHRRSFAPVRAAAGRPVP